MGKKRTRRDAGIPAAPPPAPGRRRLAIAGALVAGAVLVGAAAVALQASRSPGAPAGRPRAAADAPPGAATEQQTGQAGAPAPASTDDVLQANTAYMVTKDLDFGAAVPSVADALRQIERRSKADDGQGRTFAVLSATGEKTAEGRLRVSMHISFEKPGLASLVFRPTGEVLWSGRVVPGPPNPSPYAAKGLVVMVPDQKGQEHIVDGSRGISSIFEGLLPDLNTSVGAVWPEGQEREVVFIHSTCGCPVKVKARRAGARTVRSSDLPVVFPDDPQVDDSIRALMGW